MRHSERYERRSSASRTRSKRTATHSHDTTFPGTPSHHTREELTKAQCHVMTASRRSSSRSSVLRHSPRGASPTPSSGPSGAWASSPRKESFAPSTSTCPTFRRTFGCARHMIRGRRTSLRVLVKRGRKSLAKDLWKVDLGRFNHPLCLLLPRCSGRLCASSRLRDSGRRVLAHRKRDHPERADSLQCYSKGCYRSIPGG